MALEAGMRATPARLWLDIGGAALSNVTTPPGTLTWYAWATETIELTPPGGAIEVLAQLSGRVNGTTAGAYAGSRIGISFDSGATWTYGNQLFVNAKPAGTTAGTHRETVSGLHFRAGTPTGNVVVRAEYQVSDVSCTLQDGMITAIAKATP